MRGMRDAVQSARQSQPQRADRLPATGSPDSTFALLAEGYEFISNRCRRLGSDIFRTRLMLRPVVCMQGHAAARFFYTPGLFTRRKANPKPTIKLLQDEGSAQLLDGEAHRIRKA